MANIRVNYNNVKRQVRKLNDAESQLARELRQIRTITQAISSYWKGSTATVFSQKLNSQYSELQDLQRRIDNIAETIEDTAERLRRQEEAIERASKKL